MPVNMAAGVFAVFVSVGSRIGTPEIGLPLAGGDGARRYRIGTIQVTGDYAIGVKGFRAGADGRCVLRVRYVPHRQLASGTIPFLHFDYGGQIAFVGGSADPRDLGAGAPIDLDVSFAVPRDAWGKTFPARCGLWNPRKLGQPDERLLPDSGDTDRRVRLGTLSVDGAGAVTFVQDGAMGTAEGSADR